MHTDTTRENPQAQTPQGDDATQALAATAPGQLRVIKRNGTVVPYTGDKITVAITKAFLAVEGGNAAASSRIHDTVARLTEQVTATFKRRMPSGGTIHIEEIQDQVELALMRSGEQKVARDYVIYREAQANKRKTSDAADGIAEPHPSIRVTLADGSLAPLDMGRLNTIVTEACEGLLEVDGALIQKETLKNLYDGVAQKDVNTALVMPSRTLVEREPNYSYVTARLLMDNIRAEGLSFLNVAASATHHEMAELYAKALPAYVEAGIEFELLDPKLKTYDLEKLGKAINHERDQQFTYLGLQTLYDRYFIHKDGVRFELPQVFFMRVAMGLAIEEPKNREDRAIEFYNLLSSFDYMASTPTLFNAGTLRPQLSSCYLTTVPDDLGGIYDAIRDNALLSKFAGGLGNDWTPVRSLGAYIKGTNGKSQGVVPFLKVVNDTAVAVNQGGKRKGAVCAYLETWHMDIEEFIELRKNTGDDRRRTHDMNTANWIPDLFMRRVMEKGSWTLFSPSNVPDLHDLFGADFEKAYVAYEEKAARGEIKPSRTVQATDLWRKMLTMLFETGHPWITFKDACNVRSPQQHAGVVHSSNLCTEITLNTSDTETAVCNLGSVNLLQHLKDGKVDQEKLKKTISTAMRMLDNVIDINYYAVKKARDSNLRHRPVGLGLMGFQDALYDLRIPYASQEAVQFADESMEAICYHAYWASTELARERGKYSSYKGSLWDKGILPIDSLDLLEKARGGYVEVDRSSTLDWDALRAKIKADGMRNSNCVAIAPTATISNIIGVDASIEPCFGNLSVKSNLSGEFTVINHYLVRDLKRLGLWDDVMVMDLKHFDGSLRPIDRVPQDVKALYATAFEVETTWLVEAAARRQKWIDQAQSLNIYMAGASGKKLDDTYKLAWLRGLKTTYYLRTQSATHAEKSTVQSGRLNAVSSGNDAPSGMSALEAAAAAAKAQMSAIPATDIAFCGVDDPTCEACQ